MRVFYFCLFFTNLLRIFLKIFVNKISISYTKFLIKIFLKSTYKLDRTKGGSKMNYTNNSLRQNSVLSQLNNYSQYQNTISQPIFPQPSGNVYFVNNNLEVANIPIGAGMSAVLCLPENLLYIKTMQNNMPMLLGYKLSPLEPSAQSPDSTSTDLAAEPQSAPNNEKFEEKLLELSTQYDKKIKALEQTIQELDEKVGGILQCQF